MHEFELVCDEIATKIDIRLASHAQFLQNGASLFAAFDTVTRVQWKMFYENSKFEINQPGIQGIGFTLLINKKNLSEHLRKIRSEGFPDYKIRPEGEREIYSSIIYLEPFQDRNLRAFGYDMFSEPIRRKAMEQARDNNAAALSDKVILVQETGKDVQAGNLMFVPLYRKGKPLNTIEERRSAILGWVYSPFRMNDLMQGILGRSEDKQDEPVHLRIFDNEDISESALLFNSERNQTERKRTFEQTFTKTIDFNGKKWTLLFIRRSEHPLYSEVNVQLVLVGGILISILLFLLSLSLSRTQIRARQIADRLTYDLNQSEKRFSLFMDYLPAMAFLKDNKGKLLYVNKYMDNALGASNWLGKDSSEIFPDETGTKQIADDFRVMKAGYEKIDENIVQTDGKLHYLETQKFIIPRENQEPYLGGISLDITERKLAEERIKIWADIFRYAKWGVTVGSADGKSVIIANPEFAAMHGYELDEIIGFPIQELFAPEYREELISKINLSHQMGHYSWESVHIRKDGTKFPVLIDVTSVLDEENQPSYRIVNVLDISKQKEDELSLKEKNKEIAYQKELLLAKEEIETINKKLIKLNNDKDQFISIIAHDLKSPFNSILGFLNLLSMNLREYDTERIEEQINIIYQSAQNVFNLLEGILLWGRAQAGHIEYNPELLNFKSVCEEVIENFSLQALNKKIEISLLTDEHLVIHTDKNMLKTILRNLISNAVKYTYTGGRIIISTGKLDSEILVKVSDNGTGINPSLVNHLFDFSQVSSAKGTANEKGTGLGLLICKEFVMHMGGKIWVESELQIGSTFYFTIGAN